MSCDDFKVVTSKRRGKKPIRQEASIPCISRVQGESDISVDIQNELLKINSARSVVDESSFSKGVKNICQDILHLCSGKSVSQIICYGLGHFTECNASRYQLALLLILEQFFKATVYIHDPVFYKCEVNVLKELGFSVIEENEEGKRKLVGPGLTFLYFPHCPKQLVNNFLWKNWGPGLSDCIIFGNSFSTIVERLISSSNNLVHLVKIQPYVQEFSIVNNFKYLDVFNDTSIHVFPEEKLSAVVPAFWFVNSEEPVYPDSDLEIFKRKP